MKRQQTLSTPLLWAAAIIAAALFGAPPAFSAVLLPALAVASLLTRSDTCFKRNPAP